VTPICHHPTTTQTLPPGLLWQPPGCHVEPDLFSALRQCSGHQRSCIPSHDYKARTIHFTKMEASTSGLIALFNWLAQQQLHQRRPSYLLILTHAVEHISKSCSVSANTICDAPHYLPKRYAMHVVMSVSVWPVVMPALV
jgi:hypothetical protein